MDSINQRWGLRQVMSANDKIRPIISTFFLYAPLGLTVGLNGIGLDGLGAYAQSTDEVYAIEERYEATLGDGVIIVSEFNADEVKVRGEANDQVETLESDASTVIATHEYTMARERAGGRLSVTLVNQAEDGGEIEFVYDQAEDEVVVTLNDEDELAVAFIQGEGLLDVGDQECGQSDYLCVAKAARAVFPGIAAEDVAALDFSLRQDLQEMEEGYQIRLVLNLLSDDLAE